ncbi:frizzled-6-like isoform X2 [Sinocyclocheilus anshuiensis]|uniref:frizzled-6-like isoform X2 n=1 Tax=Sinocyclocheilus anshuiensis TaxID=1608454 RepID=UPI0007BA1FF7|nr:PREDICTED: frizzled-6-like isoform X2 [Sinocyclocheilus anshuiensis]
MKWCRRTNKQSLCDSGRVQVSGAHLNPLGSARAVMQILLGFGFGFFMLDSCMSHTSFTCEPVHVQWCHSMPYNSTFFPNMLEHYDQDIAAVKMKAFVPECTDHTRVLRPCRELCERVLSDCSRDMLTFGISWPSELQCDR